MTSWEDALLAFATRVPTSTRWMLVGSAATAIHQVPVRPEDVDILLHPESSDEELLALSEPLAAFASTRAVQGSLGDFVSSLDTPWAEDGPWTFGRWIVADVPLEVARIRSEVPASRLVETEGEAVWATTEYVAWRDVRLPVVPLEVQLATSQSRGLSHRVEAIEARLATARSPQPGSVQRAFDARGLPPR